MNKQTPSDEQGEDHPEEKGDEEEADLPPPATWAGRQSREDGENGDDGEDGEPTEPEDADEEVGRGITDEFSLEDEDGEWMVVGHEQRSKTGSRDRIVPP